ncbi:MAG: hypothetical protein AAF447_28650 [Myxococcota bacterium]
MGLFGKIFGGPSLDALREKADAQVDRGDTGGARLTLERLHDRLEPGPEREAVAERIVACLDTLAEARVREAERLIAQGDVPMAHEELDQALEIAGSEAVREKARQVRDRLDQDAARAAAVVEEIDDDTRWSYLQSTWDDAQAEELDGYGEELRAALFALHDGDVQQARERLDALLAEAEAPRYLWLEVARARLRPVANADADADAEEDEGMDRAGGREALEEFLESLADDEVGEPLLSARIELARIADHDDDFERAMVHLEAAVEAFADDYRAYFVMGQFLRRKGHAAEAVDVLESAARLMGDADHQVLQELGLALDDADREDEAVERLEGVLAMYRARGMRDLPVPSAERLAVIYEARGKADRAADLWTTLASGSLKARRAEFLEEAARLLTDLGHTDDARRMLQRALAHVESRAEEAAPGELAEQRAALEARLDALTPEPS